MTWAIFFGLFGACVAGFILGVAGARLGAIDKCSHGHCETAPHMEELQQKLNGILVELQTKKRTRWH